MYNTYTGCLISLFFCIFCSFLTKSIIFDSTMLSHIQQEEAKLDAMQRVWQTSRRATTMSFFEDADAERELFALPRQVSAFSLNHHKCIITLLHYHYSTLHIYTHLSHLLHHIVLHYGTVGVRYHALCRLSLFSLSEHVS